MSQQERQRLVNIYTTQIAQRLTPSNYDPAFVTSIADDLSSQFLGSVHGQHSPTRLFQTALHFINGSPHSVHLPQILSIINRSRDPDKLKTRLAFMATIMPPVPSPPVSSSSQGTSQGATSGTSRASQSASQSASLSGTQEGNTTDQQEPKNLIKNIQFALLGLDSSLFSFAETHTTINLSPEMNSSENALVRAILECALIFKNICSFFSTNRGRQNSPVKSAFVEFLEAYILTYTDHINTVFANNPSLLTDVYAHIHDQTAELRILRHLLQQFPHDNTPDFLSRVHSLSQRGNHIAQRLGQSIYQEILRPYNVSLHQWILGSGTAELDFFVKTLSEPTLNFNARYTFLPQLLPSFVLPQLGERIFQAGKTLVFLVVHCDDLEWTNRYIGHYQMIFQQGEFLLPQVVEEQYRVIMSRLVHVLYNCHNAYVHIRNLKKFYLIQCCDLMDKVLREGGDRLARNRFDAGVAMDTLHPAVARTSARDSPFANLLTGTYLHDAHGHYWWEVFTIKYHLKGLAIDPIIGDLESQYLKLFNFLWKVRHLHTSIVCLHGVAQKVGRYRSSYRTSRNLAVARHTMANFTETILGYLLFDVIERGFAEFVKGLRQEGARESAEIIAEFSPSYAASTGISASASTNEKFAELTLDEFSAAHAEYIGGIVRHKLIDWRAVGVRSGKSFVNQLYGIFHTIDEFSRKLEILGSMADKLQIANDVHPEQAETTRDQFDLDYEKMINRIYKLDFQPRIIELLHDMKADTDLCDLGAMIYTLATT